MTYLKELIQQAGEIKAPNVDPSRETLTSEEVHPYLDYSAQRIVASIVDALETVRINQDGSLHKIDHRQWAEAGAEISVAYDPDDDSSGFITATIPTKEGYGLPNYDNVHRIDAEIFCSL